MSQNPRPTARATGPASAWGAENTRFFFELGPERVLAAVESSGLAVTGRCMALNSFENRVYDVELELSAEAAAAARSPAERRRVVKFYRPGRWTPEQILEEHAFIRDLVESEIPAIAPLPFADGRTLHQDSATGIWYAVFPKVGGRAPDELSDEQLVRLGRLLGRIHGVGAARPAARRVRLDATTYGLANLAYLLERSVIPLEYATRYRNVVEKICAIAGPWLDAAPAQRLHGDCHLGNLLWNDQGPFFLDFDDMVTGPAVQDLWLLIPGRDAEARAQFACLLEGYAEMRAFDRATLRLVEPLRALRFVHYTAWIARRWEDPAFPRAFPQFGEHRYWSEATQDLEEQLQWIEGRRDGY